MCDIDVDGHCEVWEETLVQRARKGHRCDMCRGAIEPGESYLKHFSVFEGYPNHEKQCVRCCTIVAAFRREHTTWFGPSGMRDLLAECLQEDQLYDDEADDYVPASDNALRWHYALIEMDARGELYAAAAGSVQP